MTQHLSGAQDQLEPWESPESRARNDAWRGDAAVEARRVRHYGIAGGPALPLSQDSLEQIVRIAGQQLSQMLGLNQVLAEMSALRLRLAELETWKVQHEKEIGAHSAAEAAFALELAELEQGCEVLGEAPDDFDFNAMYEGWE